MRFSILGPLHVHDGSGRPVSIGGARLRTLLVLLLLRPGQRVATDTLVDAIWGGSAPAATGNALQALVSRLRRVLGGEAEIHGDASGYRLEVGPGQVDLTEFEALTRRGRAHLAAGRPADAITCLGEALALWRGPALSDLTARGIAEDTALRLNETHRMVREEYLAALVALGRHTEALPEAEALTRAEPRRERPVELLMRALAGTGRTADAVAAYDSFRARLADDLGLDPSARLQDAHLRLLRGELSAAEPVIAEPAETARSARPGPRAEEPRADPPQLHLPSTLTSFVPREAEVDTAVDLLAQGRLVTLTGPGGAGKTRLAIETAATLAARAPALLSRGGWFVGLAPVTSGADVLDAIALALDLREHAVMRARASTTPSSPTERIAAFLGDRPALIVVDNCEHLVREVARAVEPLLARCPGLRVLATSREPLGVPGERLLTVPSLALPPADADVAQAVASPAVVLFTERAQAVSPGFAVTPGNVAHVVRITRELDGMPLALELAAARMRTMAPAQLSARLSDRFRLLTGGSRSVLPRHRTLRAVVDWSWELLDDAERRLLRRLSIFSGGATLDAVERVCADTGAEGTVHGQDTWTVLFALVDKSLVIADTATRDDAPPRYRQLETVRAYALEHLARSGEEERVRDDHARYVRDLWRESDPLLRGPRQTETLARLSVEADNFGPAMRWAVERRDGDLALDLVEYGQWYWMLDGSWRQLSRWSRPVLALLGERAPEGRAVAYACARFNLAADTGLSQDGVAVHVRQALRTLEEAGERAEHHPMLVYGLVYQAVFDEGTGEAVERLERAVDQPDPWMGATVRLLLSLVDSLHGRVDRAVALITAALEGYRACADLWGQCQAVLQMVEAVRYQDLDRCLALLDEGLDMAGSAGLSGNVAVFLLRRAQVRTELGDLEGAREDLDALVDVDTAIEDEHVVPLRMAEAAWLCAKGETERARGVLETAEPLVAGLGGFAPLYVEPVVRSMSALIAWTGGDADRAWRETAAAWWASTRGVGPVGAEVLDMFAVMLAADEPGRAVALLGSSTVLRGVPDTATPRVVRAREECRRALGDAEFERLLEQAGRSDAKAVRTQVGAWLARLLPDTVPEGGPGRD
ncbi:BTAD domain-containing putative transcriptional regulator [Nocardiopsis sp. YSL2]|uniref:AfsR/SARP family transcriptional regulator n=1 Tax=Nocardiopsis sp. YSL2 TaxID=2939492 RepID=UPI0026F467E3|nr:BTAD domain-containing putative transcriptional regulator [Nocardiopsis sp. YSL2]